MTGARAVLCLFGLFMGSACGVDPGTTPSTEPGRSIYNSSLHTVVVQNEGTVQSVPNPAGSTCSPGAVRYSLTLASLQLKTVRCVGSATMAYKEVSSDKLITTQQYNEFRLLMEGMTIVGRDTDVCANGQQVLSVSVYTLSAEQKYVDDSSQCQIKDKPLLQRSAISVALQRLDSFAQ